MTDHRLFFQLLKNELWRSGEVPERLSEKEFEQVYTVAREQTVLGLVCNAIIRNDVLTGDDNAMRVMAVKVNHERRAGKMENALHVLISCLHEHHMNYVVFKGQTLAALYPTPIMRTLGDIDFYYEFADEERVRQAIENTMGVQIHLSDLDKHHAFEYDGIRFEMHYRLETFGSSRHQHYFDDLVKQSIKHIEEVQINGVNVRILPPMMNIILCFKHLFNHFLIEGVGLRQLCDMAMLLHHYHGKIDVNELEHHLSKIGYLKAFKAVGALTVKYLGLPVEEFPLELTERDYGWADKMLDEVMKRGNFGKYHRREMRPGTAKSLETAQIAFGHCARFLPLAIWDILCLIPRRTAVSIKKYFPKR